MGRVIPAISPAYSENIEDYEYYEWQRILGKGGYGKVYLAKFRGKEVAIKKINIEEMIAARMTNRVRDELNIHIKLKHPAILEAYTCFEDANYVYLVLELCHKGDLQRYLKARGTLSEECAAYIIGQVVQGLNYLHSHMILHRDLSLSNILLTENMQVKIADFGMATQLIKPDEKHVTMCGTPNYISPEVATKSAHGLETDLWSVGIMLYTLLMGKPPFETEAIRSTLTRVVTAEYKLPLNLSENAKDLINKLLQKNPKDRIRLQDIPSHPFIKSVEKSGLRNEKNSVSKNPFINGTMDSGLGRTLSSDGRSKLRARSEERISTTPMMPMISGRSDPLSEPITKMYSNYGAKYKTDLHYKLKEDSTIPVSRGEAISLSEQYRICSDFERPRMVEKHNPKTENLTENRNADVIVKSKTLEVSPLNTNRLQPTRHKTKGAILTILDDGCVCIEFIKRRNGMEKISEVCRISSDGLRIVFFKPTSTTQIGSQPLPIPSQGADNMYSYENLPTCHHRKYLYAHRFVKLIKAKTPKLTLYTQRSKCFFMENGPDPDCEVHFYDGVKVVQVDNVVKIIDKSGVTFVKNSFPSNLETYYEHYNECYKRCLSLESILSHLEKTERFSTSVSYFPVIIGRRPSSMGLSNSPYLQGKENISHTTNNSPIMPSFDGTCSVISTTTSKSRKDNLSLNSNYNAPKLTVPGGVATLFPSGDTRVDFKDGTALTMNPHNHDIIIYENKDGKVISYKRYHQNLDTSVKEKFQQLLNASKHFLSNRKPVYKGIR